MHHYNIEETTDTHTFTHEGNQHNLERTKQNKIKQINNTYMHVHTHIALYDTYNQELQFKLK